MNAPLVTDKDTPLWYKRTNAPLVKLKRAPSGQPSGQTSGQTFKRLVKHTPDTWASLRVYSARVR
eukprot:276057-Rhodomonas_salina.1